MSLFISSVFTYDEDAGNYIQAVETADTQALEPATRKAINNFVIGCKQDGIWTAIKASCILAGARTLAGALVPLVGTAPANNGFIGIGTDYVRKTGLVGDGSTKYLDSNRNNNAAPQNSKHLAVYRTASETRDASRAAIGNGVGAVGDSHLLSTTTTRFFRVNYTSGGDLLDASTITGFWGASRFSAAQTAGRYNGLSGNYDNVSSAPTSGNLNIFQRTGNFSNARLAFYSIGESLDLARLDARVTDLINAFAVTIP